MYNFRHISCVCKQKDTLIIFNAVTIHLWCNLPVSNEDKGLVKNLYQFKKIQFLENFVKILKNKQQEGLCY